MGLIEKGGRVVIGLGILFSFVVFEISWEIILASFKEKTGKKKRRDIREPTKRKQNNGGKGTDGGLSCGTPFTLNSLIYFLFSFSRIYK